MQKYYQEIAEISNSTFTVLATDVEIGEKVRVDKQDGTHLHASVVSFDKEKVILQAFGTTKGLSTGDKVTFLKQRVKVSVGDQLLGRVMTSVCDPLDGGPEIDAMKVDVSRQSVNPMKRVVPRSMIQTGIPLIDVFNCLVESQKLPIFSIPGEPYNELLRTIGSQADSDICIYGLMGATHADKAAYIEHARITGTLDKTAMFVHLATDSPVECLMIPDTVLTVAEQFAQQGKRVMVLLSDMTAFADALKEISITMEQVPANRGYPGTLYSELARRYEKAVDFEGAGSITILAVTTMPGDDVTHPVPDNTGYITEGQYYLHGGRIDPFGSLSRLKQHVIGEHNPKSRDDHSGIMNTSIKLYADGKKARERYSMGFTLSKWDAKLLKYCGLFEEKMMDLSVNISLHEALDLGWELLQDCFEKDEIGMKKELIETYWKEK